MDQIGAALLPVFIQYGIPAITAWLAVLGTMALNSARKYADNASADRLIGSLERAATMAVHDVEQTIVPQLKRAAADGHITATEIAGVRLAAVQRIRKVMGSDGMRKLSDQMGDDAEAVIHHMIESAVRQMRHTQSTANSPERSLSRLPIYDDPEN